MKLKISKDIHQVENESCNAGNVWQSPIKTKKKNNTKNT